MFRDRNDAANQLAKQLDHYRDLRPLILAIPRGAVPMGKMIADMLSGDLDVVLVRKLRAPGNPEFAIGSIDESGWTYLADYAGQFVHDSQYIEAEKAAQLKTMQAQRKQYTPIRPPFDPENRIVIVIDDGLATGSTMIAALHTLKAKHPKKLICAVPVAPPDTLEKIKPYADEIVCLNSPRDFYAVGQFYQDFPQVSDEEVIQSLKLSRH
ncbi:MAG TPA: phosphoribosyltransferase [Nitrosomonas sp.]|nr:phosphoribosyltransferase [Nitrosomonas sp.]HMW20895.1 phosphoribosyltransferase [Nitrosomonas sp.]HMW68695.1 phosphoribosyltransferase [Nitrosomonas sp.]HMY60714.1 phosphoribosyltransferase [Nitrosomonas sp.]HNA69855.1 phosphoribosyltransferase [Nitrosomonas sp.]